MHGHSVHSINVRGESRADPSTVPLIDWISGTLSKDTLICRAW